MLNRIFSKPIKSPKALILFVFLIISSNYGCKRDSDGLKPQSTVIQNVESLFPEDSRIVGREFAARTRVAINKSPLLLQTTDQSLKFKKEIVDKYMDASVLTPLSLNQRLILRSVILAIRESKSVDEFSAKYYDITKKIPETVAPGERKPLYDAMASIHYGIQEVQASTALVLEPPIAAYGEIMAEIFEIAITTASPLGIIAFLITAGFAAYYVYSKEMCIDEYVECVTYSRNPALCSDCFRFCEAQGIWRCPPY